jgi:hypothetical protein
VWNKDQKSTATVKQILDHAGSVFADLICHVKISVEIENIKKTLAKY